MNNRRLRLGVMLLALLGLGLAAGDELILVSRLDKPVAPFRLKRDIFQGIAVPVGTAAPSAAPQTAPSAASPSAEAEPISEEIYRSIGYAGCITRNNRRIALLNISGDFQQAGEGDTVLQRFKVKSIRPDAVIIEFEGKAYEIRLTGDPNG